RRGVVAGSCQSASQGSSSSGGGGSRRATRSIVRMSASGSGSPRCADTTAGWAGRLSSHSTERYPSVVRGGWFLSFCPWPRNSNRRTARPPSGSAAVIFGSLTLPPVGSPALTKVPDAQVDGRSISSVPLRAAGQRLAAVERDHVADRRHDVDRRAR